MPRTMLPVSGLRVQGETVRPFYRPKGNGLRDIREVSAQFFVSLCDVWDQRGDEILNRVADEHPEVYFAGMIKLAQVTRVEIGNPGYFASRRSLKSKSAAKASMSRTTDRGGFW